MLKEIQIAGFKTLAQPTTIKLEPVSVLVGANNSGKTNVLAAISLIGEIARTGSLHNAINRLGGSRVVAPRLGGPPFRLTFQGEVAGLGFAYELEAPSGQSRVGTERFRTFGLNSYDSARGIESEEELPVTQRGTFWLPGGEGARPSFGGGLSLLVGNEHLSRELRAVMDFLTSIQTFDFSVPALRAPATIEPGKLLGRDGSELAAVLDELAGRSPKLRDEIDAEVHKAAQEVTRVVTLSVGKGTKVIGVEERNGQIFTADQMSDGLLIFIALSTVIQMSGGRTLIALEELEKGVHPRRISEIVDQLVRVSGNGSQFVLTTHSPVLLNEFRDYPERVLICDRDGEQTRVTALSEHPEWQEPVNGAPLGDIWYSGVLGGVPQ